MVDYWSKAPSRVKTSKKERFNYIMNLINNNGDTAGEENKGTDNTEPVDDEIDTELCSISASVNSTNGNPIKNAKITLTNADGEYAGTTGSAGGCTIKDVPYGDYEVTVDADGYVTSTDSINVASDFEVIDFALEIIVEDLDDEVDDDF